jgi:predicted enzyme related to lactoylglutathione lyase
MPAVCHWEISGTDGYKTRDFYAKLFDWEIELWSESDYGMVKGAGEGTIGGGIGGTQEGQPPGIIFYIQVDDLQKYLDKAESLGGKTIVPPTPIPEIGAFAIFSDIDGNNIGLFKSGE